MTLLRFMTSSVLLLLLCTVDGSVLSYPKEECDWMGADDMHGPYLPIGVCKQIFNPLNLSTHADDHRYSQKYVCAEDGSGVESYVWLNNSHCQGEPRIIPPKEYDDDYFSCSQSQKSTACPHAVIRFFRQQENAPADTCLKSDDGWYSEAIDTTYQCLNNSMGWYMLQCTPDGKGIIGIDYSANCEQELNRTVLYDGCNYKDKYIEVTHCDYWDGSTLLTSAPIPIDPMDPVTTESLPVAIPATTDQVVNQLVTSSVFEELFQTVADTGLVYERYDYHPPGHWSASHDSDSLDWNEHHHHHGDQHGHHHHDHHHRGDSHDNYGQESETYSAPARTFKCMSMLLLCALFCVCRMCVMRMCWRRRRMQFQRLQSVVEEGDAEVAVTTGQNETAVETLCVEGEQETVSFK